MSSAIIALNDLHNTIKKQIEATNRQSKIMFGLTIATFLLAIIQTYIGVFK